MTLEAQTIRFWQASFHLRRHAHIDPTPARRLLTELLLKSHGTLQHRVWTLLEETQNVSGPRYAG